MSCFPVTSATDREKREILHWLEPSFEPRGSDPSTLHIERTKLREPDTCEWMTNCTLWQDWLGGGSSSPGGCRRFLWIHGLPGSGKTILASYLNDKVAVHCGAKGNSYYYCLHEHNRDETVPFLRYVIRDFCFQLGRFVPEELRTMWQYKRLGVAELQECLRVVTKEFFRRFSKRTYIIVDAVDESVAPRELFLKVLTSIGKDPVFSHVSLLMTSRDEPDIRDAIDRLPRLFLPLTSQSTSELAVRSLPSTQRSVPLGQASSEIMPTVRRSRLFSGPDFPVLSPPTFGPRCGASQPYTPTSISSPVSQSRKELDYGGFDARSTATTSRAEMAEQQSPSPTRPSPAPRRHVSGDRSPSPTRRRVSEGGSYVAGENLVDTDPIEISDEEHHDLRSVSPCSNLSMSNNFVREAIAAVIEKRLQESGRFGQWPREDFIPRLKYELAAKAAGIFRAVACYLDLIDRQKHLIDDDRILDAISKMPDTIYDQYERILTTGIPNAGDLNQHSRDFARTALALICSDSAEIPDVDVLVEASRFNVPQGRAQAYNLERLKRLLGCLVKVSRLRKKPASSFPRGDKASDFQRLTVAHYTVKEYLYNKRTANGPASDFALSSATNRALELKIVFYGLQQFLADRRVPTKFEEYCIKMTEKALFKRPAMIAKEKDIWEAVHPCLGWNDAHQSVVKKNKTRTIFPAWHKIANAFMDEARAPRHRHTCIVVSLLLLEWPKLAEVYLGSLGDDEKDEIWQDTFTLRDSDAKTVLEMCVSGRRLDFLDIFVDAGATFEGAKGILFLALEDPYRNGESSGSSSGSTSPSPSDDGSTTGTLLRVLLERGANPNPGGRKWTPLQIATRQLEPAWVDELLYHGAEPDAVGSDDDDDICDREEGSAKWYHKTPLQICKDTRPCWTVDDDDANLHWSRDRVEHLLLAKLKNLGSDPDQSGVDQAVVITLLDD